MFNLTRLLKFYQRPAAIRHWAAALLCYALHQAALAAPASVTVSDPWIRIPAPHSDSAVAYMELTASADMVVTGASTASARRTELRQMVVRAEDASMDKVTSIPLARGQQVSFRLAPAQYHLVLVDIRRPLKADQKVPLTLYLADAKGRRSKVTVLAEVRSPKGRTGPVREDIH